MVANPGEDTALFTTSCPTRSLQRSPSTEGVEVQSLEELRTVDRRVQMFTPYGLGMDRVLTPESAVEYQQTLVERLELVPEVAEATRIAFDRLRHVYAYGALCCDLYTMVNDHALLLIELALRERFVEFYGGKVTFLEDGDEREIAADRYDHVFDYLNKRRPRAVKVRLPLPGSVKSMAFNGMLHDLWIWARQVGLVRGQRSRSVEGIMRKMRNGVAHPMSPHLMMPVDALRTLRDLAEIINQLWGSPTPNGRLYPAPVRRDPIVLCWRPGATMRFAASSFEADLPPEPEQWECVILLAVARPWEGIDEPNLYRYDSRFETTHYPTEYLWGPGSIFQAADWYAANRPQSDAVQYLDQIFLVNAKGGRIYQPRRPQYVVCLADEDRSGVWFAIMADHARDAYVHSLGLVANTTCSRKGECRNCHAATIGIGTYEQVVRAVPGLSVSVAPAPGTIPDIRLPFSVDRHRQIAGQTVPAG